MSHDSDPPVTSSGNAGSTAIRTFRVEVIFACLLAILGGVAIWDSLRLGIGWASDGPRSGFFPFWIGVILVLVSLFNLAQAVRHRSDSPVFAHTHELKLVATIAIPAAIFIAAIPILGIYVASALLIISFMRWLGGYGWLFSASLAIGVALTFFVVFEIWFLVALPKGPLETALGY
jgi:putative tricarboxylic transport membrane protein